MAQFLLDEIVDELMSKPLNLNSTSNATLKEYDKLLRQYTKHKFYNLGRSTENRNFNPTYNKYKPFVEGKVNYDNINSRKVLLDHYREYKRIYDSKFKDTKYFSNFRKDMAERMGSSTMTKAYNDIKEAIKDTTFKQELLDYAKEHNIDVETVEDVNNNLNEFGLTQLDFERLYWSLYSQFMEESGYTEVLRNRGSAQVQKFLMEQLKDPKNSYNALHELMIGKIIDVYKNNNTNEEKINLWK